MLDFNEYLSRRDEAWIQDIIEQLERREGITANIHLSLEERWDALMQPNPSQQLLAA